MAPLEVSRPTASTRTHVLGLKTPAVRRLRRLVLEQLHRFDLQDVPGARSGRQRVILRRIHAMHLVAFDSLDSRDMRLRRLRATTVALSRQDDHSSI
jgi:hypothetical protein